MCNVSIQLNYGRESLQEGQIAFFIDRDGTFIKHVDYLHDPEKVELLPGVKETMQMLLAREALLFIFTNQSGVGRGYFKIDAVYACQRRLFELLEIDPSQLAGWCIAPEAPDVEGGYRKPSPRFIREAQAKFNFDLNNAHVIGDTLVDLETAWNAGAQAWAVGCGKPELPRMHAAGKIQGSYRFAADLPAAVERILDQDE